MHLACSSRPLRGFLVLRRCGGLESLRPRALPRRLGGALAGRRRGELLALVGDAAVELDARLEVVEARRRGHVVAWPAEGALSLDGTTQKAKKDVDAAPRRSCTGRRRPPGAWTERPCAPRPSGNRRHSSGGLAAPFRWRCSGIDAARASPSRLELLLMLPASGGEPVWREA